MPARIKRLNAGTRVSGRRFAANDKRLALTLALALSLTAGIAPWVAFAFVLAAGRSIRAPVKVKYRRRGIGDLGAQTQPGKRLSPVDG
jgi:hypothetical protein